MGHAGKLADKAVSPALDVPDVQPTPKTDAAIRDLEATLPKIEKATENADTEIRKTRDTSLERLENQMINLVSDEEYIGGTLESVSEEMEGYLKQQVSSLGTVDAQGNITYNPQIQEQLDNLKDNQAVTAARVDLLGNKVAEGPGQYEEMAAQRLAPFKDQLLKKQKDAQRRTKEAAALGGTVGGFAAQLKQQNLEAAMAYDEMLLASDQVRIAEELHQRDINQLNVERNRLDQLNNQMTQFNEYSDRIVNQHNQQLGQIANLKAMVSEGKIGAREKFAGDGDTTSSASSWRRSKYSYSIG